MGRLAVTLTMVLCLQALLPALARAKDQSGTVGGEAVTCSGHKSSGYTCVSVATGVAIDDTFSQDFGIDAPPGCIGIQGVETGMTGIMGFCDEAEAAPSAPNAEASVDTNGNCVGDA